MKGQSFISGWKALVSSMPVRQRVFIALTALVAVGGFLAFSFWRTEQDYKPLYRGMEAEDAGAIVEKLKESAVPYRVSDSGTTVLVPSAKVAELRLLMASAGLPKTGRMGFELFDKPSLGITDFTEQVNYRRALEGELERSIKSIAEVEQARVHVSFPKDSVFLENKLPAKASVLLKLRPGAVLHPENVLAVSHLVASAVEGLTPDAVSVMDVHGRLLSRPLRNGDGADSSEAMEYRQRVEKDLLAKVTSTLDPLLGSDKYRISVSVDCDFASGEQSEELYDPERTVMLTSQKSEETSGVSGAAGVPGAASNLPRPPGRASSASGGISRRTENISYQASKTVRRMRLPQGTIKRISASLVLDQAVRWEGKAGSQKRVLTPPTPESLRAIREIVVGAIGIVPTRGDALVIESLPFESTLQAPAPESGPQPGNAAPHAGPLALPQLSPVIWAAIGGGVFVLLAALLLVKKLLRKRKKRGVVVPSAIEGSSDAAVPAGALPSASDISALEQTRDMVELQESLQSLPGAQVKALVGGVRSNVENDAAMAAEVVRKWLQQGKR